MEIQKIYRALILQENRLLVNQILIIFNNFEISCLTLILSNCALYPLTLPFIVTRSVFQDCFRRFVDKGSNPRPREEEGNVRNVEEISLKKALK